jgi:predicted RNase H-like HicB family nuclease/ribosomal protein L31E
MSSRNLDYYLSLNYNYQVSWDADSEAYGAMVLELPGCVATGDTPAEAIDALDESKQAYLEVAMAEGWEIPEPSDAESYSGKVLVRMASTLHMQLVQWAEQEGTSLNQLIITALAHAAGTRMLQPIQDNTGCSVDQLTDDVNELIFQARREIEAGTDCELGLKPLRELLLVTCQHTPVARTLLTLVDLISHSYRLAEIRTRQKEQAALARRAQKIAVKTHKDIIRGGFEAEEVERDRTLAEQSWQKQDVKTPHGIPVPNWPTKKD